MSELIAKFRNRRDWNYANAYAIAGYNPRAADRLTRRANRYARAVDRLIRRANRAAGLV